MRTSMVKSQFLRLAYHTQAGGAVDPGHLDTAEAEVQRLCRELEASQRLEEESTHRESRAQSQIEVLTS